MLPHDLGNDQRPYMLLTCTAVLYCRTIVVQVTLIAPSDLLDLLFCFEDERMLVGSLM